MKHSTMRTSARGAIVLLLAAAALVATGSYIRADGDNDYQEDLTGMPDLIYGNAGADYIAGAGGDDWLNGNADNDQLYGGGGADFLVGGYGDDKLDGGPGQDLLAGGRDDDTLTGGDGADLLYGDGGDYMEPKYAGAGLKGTFDETTSNVTIVENGKTYGGDKMIFGTHDAGTPGIVGNLTVDVGDDVLNGGPGDDVLNGGGGTDRFVFGANCGHDTIQDYEEGEVLDLTGLSIVSLSQTTHGSDMVISANGSPIITLENYSGAVRIVR